LNNRTTKTTAGKTVPAGAGFGFFLYASFIVTAALSKPKTMKLILPADKNVNDPGIETQPASSFWMKIKFCTITVMMKKYPDSRLFLSRLTGRYPA